MSHFTVLVIGEDAEGQLAPYDEAIQTVPYNEGEVSESEKTIFMEHYIDKDESLKDKTFDELYVLHGNDWNDNAWKLIRGEWCEFSTYNSDSKWDWYSLGGRWSGFFKAKVGVEPVIGRPGVFNNKVEDGYSDEILKGDVDFEFMERRAIKKATERYDKVYPLIKDTPINRTWEDIISDDTIGDMETKRIFYGEQPRVKAFKESGIGHSANIEPYNASREEYIKKESACPYGTFAMVKDGIWMEKGEMDWWGMSKNEMAQDKWDAQLMEVIKELPDDTMLSLYDCHI